MASQTQFILGSRSPRRLELLSSIVPADSITVLPPECAKEAGFEGLHSWTHIEERLQAIARTKNDDVVAQLEKHSQQEPSRNESTDVVVLTADTVIVAYDLQQQPCVLGQPPHDASWQETVREWFVNYYAGRTHHAATAFCLTHRDGQRFESVVKTAVSFTDQVDRWLDWYLSTEEPRGKAGGYALQGAGSIFVTRVEGSMSNVVGLPLRELLLAFEKLGLLNGRGRF